MISREGWPDILNPMYGAVVALQVRQAKGESIIQDPNYIYRSAIGLHIDIDPSPDMMILGDSNIVLPLSLEGGAEACRRMPSPLYIEGQTELNVWKIEKHAFAIGICNLLWAIDTIRLGPLPWSRILDEGINSRGSY
jgi:hypothetical protein